MEVDRREFLYVTGVGVLGSISAAPLLSQGASQMHGLIGKMTAVPGQRDAVIAMLVESVSNMPGCLSYIIAKDAADADGIWITEIWDNKDSHAASLTLPAVTAVIAKARPLIAGMGPGATTTPVGGHGLPVAKNG